jgi:tRNA(fMet)-specific endonuclease VapC
MTVFLLDTDTFSLYIGGHPAVIRNISRHTSRTAVAGTTVEEMLNGWQHHVRTAKADAQRAFGAARYAEIIEALSGWPVLPLTVSSLARLGTLVRARLNVGGNDLKIAAVALEVGATVVTRNARDFRRVSGLSIVDWTV